MNKYFINRRRADHVYVYMINEEGYSNLARLNVSTIFSPFLSILMFDAAISRVAEATYLAEVTLRNLASFVVSVKMTCWSRLTFGD